MTFFIVSGATGAALDRMRQIIVDARDGLQNEIAQGASEDQAGLWPRDAAIIQYRIPNPDH